ncbi:MAG: bifunctional serine/threonine-protein kinase/formylglycine-generating enzyme family protein [Acidobacteriota bacterium]|nr:bifunctional serine/threonine-protein kinase/formylglycine-generating enzyme family protein [Blastocatellia bacterium]MDW8411575.1 bifunctional serine/threonine-protein kinase/formylglycine-generating enzyme family protein [Acidobacteriota bacterium]
MKYCDRCRRKFAEHMVFCPFDGDVLILETQDPLIGKVLDGKYRLESRIGEGGMGAVYRARHVLIQNELAVKVLHSHLVSDRHAVARFQREAMAAARIRHPNAIGVYDFGVTETDDKTEVVYIVMELFIGQSLREALERKGPLPIERAVLIIRQVCLAIEAAHRSSVIHRDVKPDNIVIEKNGEGDLVKVLDFGIAKLLDSGPYSRLTRQGVIIGSPHYLSPEQCQNLELDTRSDIYSIGVVLYEMLTGDVPFKAPTPIAVAMLHASEQPIPVRQKRPSVPEPIERVVMKALSKNPDERQQTALDLGEEIEEACRQAGIPVLPLPGNVISSSLRESYELHPGFTPAGLLDSIVQALDFEQLKTTNGDIEAALKKSLKTTESISPEDSSVSDRSMAQAQEIDISKTVFPRPFPEPKKKNYLTPVLVATTVLLAASTLYLLLGNQKPSPVVIKQELPVAQAVTPPPAPEGMIFVPGGKFLMGSNDGEKYDRPQHEATVAPFYLDRTEVTNKEYKKFIDATGHPAPKSWKAGSYPAGQDLWPVTGVSWSDAAAYARWVGKRLPTEVEWEYAARGKEGLIYPWGNAWDKNKAVSKETKRSTPAEVASCPQGAGPFGHLDLAGNVWEWTADNYFPYPGNKEKIDTTLSRLKVIRGGSFKSDPKMLVTYLRNMVPAELSDSSLGFRCAKSVE